MNRLHPLTRREFGIHDSRVDRRDRLQSSNGRPRIVYVDRDIISQEVEILIRDGEPSIQTEFASIEEQHFEHEELLNNSDSSSEDLDVDTPDNISECSTVPYSEFDFGARILLDGDSSSVEFSPSPSPLDFHQEPTQGDNVTEEGLSLDALLDISDEAFNEVLETLNEESLADFWEEINT